MFNLFFKKIFVNILKDVIFYFRIKYFQILLLLFNTRFLSSKNNDNINSLNLL